MNYLADSNEINVTNDRLTTLKAKFGTDDVLTLNRILTNKYLNLFYLLPPKLVWETEKNNSKLTMSAVRNFRGDNHL